MSNYSYTELQNMQRRAMERVSEMKRKSEAALAGETNGDPRLHEGQADGFPDSRAGGKIEPKITNMPPNFPPGFTGRSAYPDFAEYFKNGEKSEDKKPASKRADSGLQPQGGISALLDSVLAEPDRAVILGLLLLLKSEGADEALMMALTYIML